jgi:hypothetical protein
MQSPAHDGLAMGLALNLTWRQAGQTSTFTRQRTPSRLTIARGDTEVQLRLSGDGDRSYEIEASMDPIQWSVIATNTVWEGPISINAPEVPEQRFFRLK